MTDKPLQILLERGRRSSRAGFRLPVIRNYEEAARVVRTVAEELARLSWADRAILLADLRQFDQLLHGRAKALHAAMEETQGDIARISRSASGCAAYARAIPTKSFGRRS